MSPLQHTYKHLAMVWLSSLCLLLQAAAQNSYLFNTKRLIVKDGLAHQEVYDIFQDKRGFIWMGTRAGLNRYNGYTFNVYSKEKNGLSNNSIHTIKEDSAGNLWLFSQGNASRKSKLLSIDLLNIATGNVKSFAQAFPQAPFAIQEVEHYFFSDQGFFFFYTKKILWQFALANNQFTPVTLPPAFSPEGCTAADNIWGISGNQYQKLDVNGKVVMRITVDSIERSKPIYLGETEIYLLFAEKKIKRFAINPATRPLLAPVFEGAGITAIKHLATTGETWVTGDKAVYKLDTAGNMAYHLDNSTEQVLERGARKIFIDRLGLVWIATDAGVLLIEGRKEKFARYLYTDRKQDPYKEAYQCRGMLQQGNHLFVATYKGIVNIDLSNNASTIIPALKEEGDNLGYRFPLFKGVQQGFLAGARLPIVLDASSGQELQFIKGNKQRIWSFYEDGQGRLLVGTERGLLQYDKRSSDTIGPYTAYNQYTELAKAAVIQIVKDRTGICWVVTSFNGLYVLDEAKGIVDHYGTAEKKDRFLRTDNFQHLYQDAAGIYWLASGDAGLIQWNRQTGVQRQYTRGEGLSSNNLYAVYEDKRGYLWISSDYGLMRFNKADGQVTVYTPEDGISHYEFNRISHYQAADGRLYFGSLNGITAFYPEAFYDSVGSRAEQVMIAGFQQYLGSKGNLVDLTNELLATNQIVVNPSDRFFSLSLAVPDYIHTDKIVYYYMIEGVDKDWNKTNSNEIRFGRLPYGRYNLRIKAQMANGRFTEEVKLQVHTKRPWFLQWWFYVLAALLIGLGVRFYYRWRIRQLQLRKKELEKIVDERTQELKQDKATIEKQATELRQLDEMKSNFFVNVAHELRTPLTLLAGPVKQLVQQSDKAEKGYPYLKLMEQNVQQLQHKVNEILDFSKLEAGKLELLPEPLHLHGFLQLLLAPFVHAANQKQVAFEWTYGLPEQAYFMLDKGKLTNILNNLLSNALKFTPAGGKIDFNVEGVGEGLQFIVADNGPGIGPGDQDNIFKRYYQAKGSAVSASGTGIGLAFVKELVQLMQGSITVQSGLGQGARFTVQLPSTSVEPEKVQAICHSQQANRGMTAALVTDTDIEPQPTDNWKKNVTILLVEDNVGLQQFIELELGAHYQIIKAHHGADALELLRQRTDAGLPVHLIISDIMMPVMDGFAFLDYLKKLAAWQKIPVIMLTARSGIADKLAAFRIGVDDYMAKPFDAAELMARVNNLLRRQYARTYFAEVESMDEPKETASTPPDWLLQLQQVIKTKLDNQPLFTIEDIAAELYISTRQLQRNIKTETGLTLNNYIKDIRLHQAMELLEQKKYVTVAEYSYAVGFNDPHYFSKIFAERFGKKPTDYLA
jgi:signal transduction histidine kinase/DNA-binding response OmpR family regulator/ligand-binding sensor domain-containing protein